MSVCPVYLKVRKKTQIRNMWNKLRRVIFGYELTEILDKFKRTKIRVKKMDEKSLKKLGIVGRKKVEKKVKKL